MYVIRQGMYIPCQLERLSQMVVMSVLVTLAVCVLMYGLYEIIVNDITI